MIRTKKNFPPKSLKFSFYFYSPERRGVKLLFSPVHSVKIFRKLTAREEGKGYTARFWNANWKIGWWYILSASLFSQNRAGSYYSMKNKIICSALLLLAAPWLLVIVPYIRVKLDHLYRHCGQFNRNIVTGRSVRTTF